MNSSTIEVTTPDGVADCYLTKPAGDGAHPGVLFMIDAIGLRPRIEEMADRIAAQGYVVLAPNVFYRAGRAPLWDTLGELADGPVGATGYCFGGRLGWMIAAAYPDRVAALGGFHTGRMVTDDEDSPHLLAPRVRGEVYWGHADQDQSMTAENIATLDQAMDDAGVRHTTELYEGAQHGYTMSDMGAYNEAAAERHFTALFALLQRAIPR
jgi:carboxymethylenebutenolidase